MLDLNKIYLFRMTHIENIPHILNAGITHISSANRNTAYKPIGDSSLINRRNSVVTPNSTTLGDYIPFYFGTRMPMLYVVEKGFNGVSVTAAEKIIYCISSVQKIIDLNLGFIFTDGHAVNELSSFYSAADVTHIHTLIDTSAINAHRWNDEADRDLKRRKEAEFLIASDVPIQAILGYAVYNESAKVQLNNLGIPLEKIVIRPNYYFGL